MGIPCSIAFPFEFYGDGIVQEKSEKNSENFSPFTLSCDFGETQTAFVTYHNLRPGYYTAKALVRADNVQKGKDEYSFWHFYDGGFGVKTIFADLYGSYGFREISYPLQVKNSDLTVWFRLKSPGKVYVDSFQLVPAINPNGKIRISDPLPFKQERKQSILQPSRTTESIRRPLFHFNNAEMGHSFDLKKDTQNGGVGVVSAHKYYHFFPERLSPSDWSDFDRIEFDLYNPNDDYISFNFTMADDLSTGYWSQLNHNEILAPGWNHISLSLSQYVGERGSVKFFRSLNLKKIKKIFMGIDPEGRNPIIEKTFYLDNVNLLRDKMPLAPKNIWTFDFTSHKAHQNSFIPITTQSIFSLEKGMGFINPEFWRVEDSFGPSSFLRYSIGILSGKFRVNVPNGSYRFQLIADKLGFWDVPFYRDRTFFVNGRAFYKESRNAAQDFLKDFLRFENVIPSISDHPFSLYHGQVFKKIEGSVDVKNGQIDFDFAGDASAISLNTLILWEKKETKVALQFIDQFNKRNRKEFNWQTRPLRQVGPGHFKDQLEVNAIALTKKLDPFMPQKSLGQTLTFLAGENEKDSQLLQILPLKNGAVLNFKKGVFKNSKNEVVKNISFKVSEVINQFVSPGMGHETYLLNGTYLRELKRHSFETDARIVKYLWIDVQTSSDSSPGIYTSSLELSYNNHSVILPIVLKVLPYELPKLDFPVGFLGLDPLPYSYFSGNGWREIRKKYRFLALKELSEAGFSTFSGLPEVPLRFTQAALQLETKDLEETLSEATRLGFKGPFFSYGGQFPEWILRPLTYPMNMSEDEYYQRVSGLLRPLLSKKHPQAFQKIVYLFSDEASGYSQKTSEDYQFGQKIKKILPELSLGGFSFFEKRDVQLENLNHLFDFGFYSLLTEHNSLQIKKQKGQWGFYNAVPGNLDDPRFAFGIGLFLARQKGLAHYLEWNSIGFNHYPYFDFDGRESDVALFYPSLKEGLYPSVRFELARIGLATFRKLILLERKMQDPGVPDKLKNEVREFLSKLRSTYPFEYSNSFLNPKKTNDSKSGQYDSFCKDIDNLLLKIFLNG